MNRATDEQTENNRAYVNPTMMSSSYGRKKRKAKALATNPTMVE